MTFKHFTPIASKRLQNYAGCKQDNKWSDVIRYMRYLGQEFIEATEAVNTRDIDGFRDAIADMRVLLDAFSACTTIDLEEDYSEVVNKLETRFDLTEEDALLTKKKYEALGVTTETKYNQMYGIYATVVTETVTGVDGEYYPKGKFMKSHKFSEPQLKAMTHEMNNDTEDIIECYTNKGVKLLLSKDEV